MLLKHCLIITSICLFVEASVSAYSIGTESLPQIITISCPAVNKINVDSYSQSEVAKFLGWVRDPKSDTLCGGSYIDPNNIINTKTPKAVQDIPMHITSSEHAFFTLKGTSIIKGNVTMIQPGREITADCVTLFRDNKTGKVINGVLVGHVNFHEYGKLIVAQQSNLNFVSNVHTSGDGFYRILSSTPSGITNIWGRTKHAVRDAAGVLRMKHATYSPCPPDATSWYLWSNKLTLDRNTGRGVATNSVLFFKKVPVFYTPYFNFPLDKTRKSGFLFSVPTYSKGSGFGLPLSYYFNLAPNYDATFTPTFFTKRGVLLDGLFNYLTPISNGSINAKYIPHDRDFVNFRNSYSSFPATPAHQALLNSSANRGFLSLQNALRLNEHWNGSLIGNYASDDYFLQDFGSLASSINDDQLFNQAEISYAGEHWRFSGRLQEFQTLHRMNPLGASIAHDLYKKLPQLDLAADFPDSPGGLNYQFNSGVVNFVHRNSFDTSVPVVSGARFNVRSSASLPVNWLGAYIVPKVQLQATEYSTYNQAAYNPHNITQVLPIVSINSEMVFARDINFFKKNYTQTLEPRLFYLFVPTKNQNDVPVFDTNFPAFEFDQLFRTNRFSGIDRIGDANQITAAITTKFLDDYGQEKLNAGLGQIFSFHKHEVIIPQSVSRTPDPLASENLSPLVGTIQYFITPKINTKADTAWDPNNKRFNASNVNLQYNNNAEQIMNFWYTYNPMGDHDPSGQYPDANLSRVGLSLGWRLVRHWNVLGSLEYNTSYKRYQTALYGLEYDSCCFAIRLTHSRTFVGTTVKYEGRTYLQFSLKGLGDASYGDQINLIGNISGYNDKHVIGL